MRRLSLVLLLLLPIAAPAAQERVRLLLISIDGLMPSAYTDPGPARIPTLRRLARQGAFARGVVGVLPSVTYPSHTTLITGVEPAVHGIVDNLVLDPENRSNGGWHWYAEDIKVQTLVGAARDRGLTVGAVSWPATVGMALDWSVPEIIVSGHPQALQLVRALSHPRGLLSEMAAARGREFGWPLVDRDRTDQATFILRTHRPDMLLLHLIDLDAAQHRYGPGSPEALAALEQIDGYVAEVLQAAAEGAEGANLLVAVVSDHGFRRLDRQLQPNALLKREGLLTAAESGRVTAWDAYFHASGGAGFVFLRRPEDAALVRRVGDLLRGLQQDAANGIATVWTQAELRSMNAHPNASFGLSMMPGFYTAGGHDVILKRSITRGGHGFDPREPDLHASLILDGPGFAGLGDLGIVRMTQIAPTLAGALGLALPAATTPPLPGRGTK
jgi:predicted AlkP superfamily pyrophosphatase or phosphodiesterase